MKKLIIFFISCLFLTSCLETLAPNPNGYSWVSPIYNQTFYNNDVLENATEVKLTYQVAQTAEPNIIFNSQNVTSCFTFGPSEATADLYCFREFFKQGNNRLQVNYKNFGPYVEFNIETTGPSFAIREVCYEDSTHCETNPSSGMVDVLIEYRDISGIGTTTLNGVSDYSQPTSTSRRFLVNLDDTYNFYSEDLNGLSSNHTYKADGQEIVEIADVRVDETFIRNIKDILGGAVSGLSIPYGDPRLDGLQRLDAGTFGLCDVSVKAISLGDMQIKDIGITDNADAQLYTDIDILPLDKSSYTYNNGNVENINNVGVDVIVEVRTIGFFCIAPISLGDMRIYIETMEVNADVDLSVVNDKFTLILNDPQSTGENALVMVDISMDNSILDGIVDFIMGIGFVQDLIRGIVQNVINENLDEIVIGGDIITDTGTTMRIGMQPTSLYTQNDYSDNIGNMFIQMKGKVETIIVDDKVKPALGSYYVDDTDGLPNVPDNGSSIAVVLNSNIINQGLLAAYNIGVTHLTLLKGNIHIGPDATDNLGNSGDLRVELYPASPGQFFIEGNDSRKAYLEYHGAEMTISMKMDNGTWKELFLIDVDIKAGVLMSVKDSKFYMTIAETPTFIIRKMTDLKAKDTIITPFGTFSYNIVIDSKIIEGLIQEAIYFGIPYVAESELEIDISKINLPKKLSTETLSTEKGHLGFDMGVAE